MAMKETKFIQVGPKEVEKKIVLWRSFGWEMVGAPQEIKTQDVQLFTGQDSDGTEHYETTRGEHYVKLTFERDPGRNNYEELKSLQEQYNSVKNPKYPDEPVRFGLIWGALAVIGLIFPLITLAIVIWRLVRYSKKKKLWNDEYAVYKKELEAANKKRQDFLEKAQSLI